MSPREHQKRIIWTLYGATDCRKEALSWFKATEVSHVYMLRWVNLVSLGWIISESSGTEVEATKFSSLHQLLLSFKLLRQKQRGKSGRRLHKSSFSYFKRVLDFNFLGNIPFCSGAAWSRNSPFRLKDECRVLDALSLTRLCAVYKKLLLISQPLQNFCEKVWFLYENVSETTLGGLRPVPDRQVATDFHKQAQLLISTKSANLKSISHG